MANNQNVCCVPAVLNYSKLHNKKRSADHSVLLRKKKKLQLLQIYGRVH